MGIRLTRFWILAIAIFVAVALGINSAAYAAWWSGTWKNLSQTSAERREAPKR